MLFLKYFLEVKMAQKNLKNKLAVISIITLLFLITSLTSACSNSASNNEKVTYANYKQIHNSMTYNSICNILGTKNIHVSTKNGRYSYKWENGSKRIYIYFENNIVVNKSQSGLT
jgi:hypothetical protein